MTAYYNEIDPAQAAKLRQLIKLKVIADGEVDERSIEDIRPSELGGFTQCHFFAGIGGWSRALRLAGWPDDCPVWTGSCPCQSFSAAGQGKGFADERHLWPAWFHLIGEREPPIIFGEQVDAAIKHGWLDLVQTDLEAAGYAIGHAVIPAASIGAPHGRHRLWFVANSTHTDRRRRSWFEKERIRQDQERWIGSASDGSVSGLADMRSAGLQERGSDGRIQREALGASERQAAISGGDAGGVAITDLPNEHGRPSSGKQSIHVIGDGQPRAVEHGASEQARISRFARERRKTNGFWLDADWIPCRDGKWRPIEPGVFPLAHGVSGRMDLLRGFGNAIVAQQAAAFIEATT